MARIPPFNHQGVLPPYLADPAASDGRSPYEATLVDLVRRFATSEPRRIILRGYLEYREKLRRVGFEDGYQWLDGSFVEAVEAIRGRPPNDLDIVTFYRRPKAVEQGGRWERRLLSEHPELFKPQNKLEFKCDGYFVCLASEDADVLVQQTIYWYGLFSHRRDVNIWKGMVRVALASVDADAEAGRMLNEALS